MGAGWKHLGALPRLIRDLAFHSLSNIQPDGKNRNHDWENLGHFDGHRDHGILQSVEQLRDLSLQTVVRAFSFVTFRPCFQCLRVCKLVHRAEVLHDWSLAVCVEENGKALPETCQAHNPACRLQHYVVTTLTWLARQMQGFAAKVTGLQFKAARAKRLL